MWWSTSQFLDLAAATKLSSSWFMVHHHHHHHHHHRHHHHHHHHCFHTVIDLVFESHSKTTLHIFPKEKSRKLICFCTWFRIIFFHSTFGWIIKRYFCTFENNLFHSTFGWIIKRCFCTFGQFREPGCWHWPLASLHPATLEINHWCEEKTRLGKLYCCTEENYIYISVMGGSVLQWYAYCIVHIVFQWAGIVFKWIIYLWTTILWRCFLSDLERLWTNLICAPILSLVEMDCGQTRLYFEWILLYLDCIVNEPFKEKIIVKMR